MSVFKTIFYTLLVVGTLNSCKKDDPSEELKKLPRVTTSAVSNIGVGQAECGGIINSDGGLDIISCGICWSTHPNPTIADSITSDNDETGEFKSLMTNLKSLTRYYVRAYAKNKDGVAYGIQREFITISPKVGLEYGGGIVAYIFKEGDIGFSQDTIKGIIVSLDTFFENTAWGCMGTSINGTSEAIGAGLSNTELILKGCSDGASAASRCAALSVGRFNDWFLPSKDEVIEIEYALVDTLLEILTIKCLWSSTQKDDSNLNAFAYIVHNKVRMWTRKNELYSVIPARYFSVPR